MTSRHALCWCGVLGALVLAGAVGSLEAQTRPQPKVITWNAPDAQPTTTYAIVGEVSRPAVYRSARPLTLQQLVQQAGGLSAQASPAVRIVRQGRNGQTVFHTPQGADPLLPGDLVVVDPVPRPTADGVSAAPRPSASGGVWLALIGVDASPVVVPLPPEQAYLSVVVQMLGQSAELAQTVRVLTPRLPASASAPGRQAPLPNGSVLIFEPSLLVTRNLPSFPPSVDVAAEGAPAPTENGAATLAEAAPPPTDVTPALPSTRTASSATAAVSATPVPFSPDPSAETVASPASLPAPGSRLHQTFAPPPPATPAAQRPSREKKLPLNDAAEIVTASDTEDAEIAGDTPPPAAPAAWTIWEMLGISGTILSLVGLALISRKYLAEGEYGGGGATAAVRTRRTPPTRGEAAALSGRPPVEPAAMAEPPVAAAPRSALQELLQLGGDIVTEPLEFPRDVRLAPTPVAATTHRLDAPATLNSAEPHFPLEAPTRAERLLAIDAADDATPKPHFLSPHARPSAAAADEAAPVAQRLTPLERALSQLQAGARS